jgi:predicted secreted protein
LLAAADYTATNGTTVVLAAGAAANDIFTAVAYNSATQIIQGDTKVEVTDTGSNGKVTGTADNTAVFSVEKGKTFVLEGGSSSTGVGIAFPATQVASTNANTLDDYEEGSWTPVLSRTGSSYTFSFQSGRYTKIGNIVTCTFSTNISAIGTQGSGLNQISGFPFTPANLESGTLRWTGSFSLKAVLTTATSFYWSGAFFFTDGSNALQTNFTTGDMFGVITYQV